MTSWKRGGTNCRSAVALALVLLLIVSSCSDRKNPSDLPGTHPVSWSDPSAADFHGLAAMSIGVDGCAKCHGVDLDGGEVNVSCVDCHLESGACATCHGGQDNITGAPPIGLEGETEVTELAVGAHTAHLTGSSLAGPIDCDFCHTVPLFILDSSHYDGHRSVAAVDSIAEITWGGFADGGGASWDRSAGTCANTYCHGNFPGGHATNAPLWTDLLADSCGSCHAFVDDSTLTDPHSFHLSAVGLICNDCHATVIDSSLVMIDPVLHVNGLIDTATAIPEICAACHGVGEGSCITCHGGDDNISGAPPAGLRGETATSDLAVGAHTIHLDGLASSTGYPCTTCHSLPGSVADAGHLGADSIAELTWNSLAGSGSQWDRPSESCVDTYCHGNFSGGNRSNRPRWTGSDQATCGSCHDEGTTPASLGWKHNFHVAQAGLTCGECHANVIDTLSVFTDLSKHANGVIDTLTRDETVCNSCHGTQGFACTFCHGGTDNQTGAPPAGFFGVTSTDSIGVGAHTTHVEGGLFANAVDCSNCHVVPVTSDEPQHYLIDQDNIAEITWSGLSGDSANWDRVNATCNNIYCHGEFTGGNSSNAPIWTGTNQAVCGSCHDVGTDPATINSHHQTHVGLFDISCYNCHGNMVDESLNITDRSLHVNGQADTFTPDPAFCETCHASGPGACVNCHGGTDNQTGAPPVGLRGETTVSTRAVGAHTVHLDGSVISDGITCNECHLVPTTFTDSGHYAVDSIAELTWGTLAGVTSSWDRNAQTCANTYCHGNFVAGNASNTPIWTGTNQAACGTCHDVGTNPATIDNHHLIHVGNYDISCYNCHGNMVDSTLIITDRSLHVNGQVDTLTTNPAFCQTCHGTGAAVCVNCHGGTDNQSGAPPLGLRGETAISTRAVGAHSAHMDGGTISDGIACNECHLVPTVLTDPGHYAADSIAELTWGTLAGVNGSWDRNSQTCTDSYCHGDFRGGTAANQPVWNGTNQASCGSCHDVGSNPANLRDEHDRHVQGEGYNCATCHAGVTDAVLNIVGPNLHINGNFDIEFSGNLTAEWDGIKCSNNSCHGDENW